MSRVLAEGIEVDSREAFEALPDELKAKVEHPDKEKWDRVVTEHVDEDGCALVEVSKLAAIHGLEERAKLTPKQSQALAQTAEYVGLVIEPDARLTNRPYSWEDVVSLLRPEERPGLPADSRYLAASLMLELGVYVAAADGTVEDVESTRSPDSSNPSSSLIRPTPDAWRRSSASSWRGLRRSRDWASGFKRPDARATRGRWPVPHRDRGRQWHHRPQGSDRASQRLSRA